MHDREPFEIDDDGSDENEQLEDESDDDDDDREESTYDINSCGNEDSGSGSDSDSDQTEADACGESGAERNSLQKSHPGVTEEGVGRTNVTVRQNEKHIKREASDIQNFRSSIRISINTYGNKLDTRILQVLMFLACICAEYLKHIRELDKATSVETSLTTKPKPEASDIVVSDDGNASKEHQEDIVELETIRKENNGLKQANQDLHERQEAEIKTLQEVNQSLREQVREYKKESETMKKRHEDVFKSHQDDVVETIRKKNTDLKQSTQVLQERLDRQESEVKAQQEKNQSLLAKVQESVKESEAMTKSHADDLAKKETEIVELMKLLQQDHVDETCTHYVMENKALKEKNDTICKQLEGQKFKETQLASEYARSCTENTNLLNQLENERQEFTKQTEAYRRDIEHLTLTRKHEQVLKERNRGLEEELSSARHALQNLKQELDDTKRRLSQLMGQKLTDNNPNIADLSDKNRPTKLAERYTELYDNQWTDAFEVLDEGNDVDTIALLRDILYDIDAYCKEKSSIQLAALESTLLVNDTGNIPVNIRKQMKDCRKSASEIACRNMCKEYLEGLTRSDKPSAKSAVRVPRYVEECFKVCWYMSVQDPPVVLSNRVETGSAFNSDLFKTYTQSGSSVDYLVWPALFLNAGGALLSKGVAQGCGGVKKK